MSRIYAPQSFAATAAVSSSGDGETVALLLHGLGGDRHQPLGLLDGETDPRITVIAPDQRAHGETPVIGEPDDFRLDGLVDDAAALLRSRGLDDRPLILVGISMGAAVALRFIERGEHELRGALLVRPAFEKEPWPAHLLVFQEIAALLRAEGASGEQRFLNSDAYRAVAAVSTAGAESLRAQFTKPDSVDRVVRLEQVPANPSINWSGPWTPPCPVTIVGAQEDPIHPMHVAELWNEQIRTADLVVAPSRDRQPEEYDRIMQETTRDRVARWA